MNAFPRTPLLPLLACALAIAAAAPASAGAAERVRWPIAWTAGEVASYESESVVRETRDGVAQARRITDRTEIRTLEAGADGYAMAWTTHDSRAEAVEGDRSMVDMLAPMLDELDGFDVVVELDRDGRYRRVRNLDAVVAKLRATMLPVFTANLQRMFDTADPKLAKHDHDALLALARTNLEASFEDIITVRNVEAMSSAQAKALVAFAGRSLQAGKRYRDDEPMDSPREAWPLPASREYVLSVVEDDPALARIRWRHALDPRADAKVLWKLAGELTGDAQLGARVEGRPDDLDLRKEGVVVFRRDTGAVEMMEMVETSRYGEAYQENDRYRMRRIGSQRTWAQEEAANR